MTAAAFAKSRYAPPALGLFSSSSSFADRALIRVGLINRFIVPLRPHHRRLPARDRRGACAASLPAHAARRFPLHHGDHRGVVGGVLLYRYHCAARDRDLGRGDRAAAGLMYPLYLVIFGRSALTIV